MSFSSSRNHCHLFKSSFFTKNQFKIVLFSLGFSLIVIGCYIHFSDSSFFLDKQIPIYSDTTIIEEIPLYKERYEINFNFNFILSSENLNYSLNESNIEDFLVLKVLNSSQFDKFKNSSLELINTTSKFNFTIQNDCIRNITSFSYFYAGDLELVDNEKFYLIIQSLNTSLLCVANLEDNSSSNNMNSNSNFNFQPPIISFNYISFTSREYFIGLSVVFIGIIIIFSGSILSLIIRIYKNLKFNCCNCLKQEYKENNLKSNNRKENNSGNNKENNSGDNEENNSGNNKYFLVRPLILKIILNFALMINFILFFLRAWKLGNVIQRIPVPFSIFGNLISFEFYSDFEFWYVAWIPSLLENGILNLYNGAIFGYHYPPLFIITLIPFYLISSQYSLPIWIIGVPLFIFYLGIGYLIYRISKELGFQDYIGQILVCIYFLNPLNIFYAGFSWFNVTPFIFFCVLSYYYLIKAKNDFKFKGLFNLNYSCNIKSVVFLAISVSYKQFSLLIFPMILIHIAVKQYLSKCNKINSKNEINTQKEKNSATKASLIEEIFKSSLLYIPIFLATLFLIFLPFIIIDPANTINNVFFSSIKFDLDYIKLVGPSIPINFDTFFVYINAPEWLVDFIGFLLIHWILLGTSTIITYLLFYSSSYKIIKKNINIPLENNRLENSTAATQIEKSENISNVLKTLNLNLLFWTTIVIINMHLFYPRGSYKYYLLFMIAFLTVALPSPSLSFKPLLKFKLIQKIVGANQTINSKANQMKPEKTQIDQQIKQNDRIESSIKQNAQVSYEDDDYKPSIAFWVVYELFFIYIFLYGRNFYFIIVLIWEILILYLKKQNP
ncbi:MAG: hypothetical protein ACTSRZ_13090 [Promethearchaeota archaeon]